MVGAIGGGMGGGAIGGSMGGVGGTGAMGAASSASATGSPGVGGGAKSAKADSAGAPEASTKVTISQAAQKASVEPTQEGASFSVKTGSDGHKYVGGMDANGFENPDINALGQSVSELNKLDEALAAILLMLLMQKQQQ